MIANDNQLVITKRWHADFTESLLEVQKKENTLTRALEENSLKLMILEFEDEIREYEAKR